MTARRAACLVLLLSALLPRRGASFRAARARLAASPRRLGAAVRSAPPAGADPEYDADRLRRDADAMAAMRAEAEAPRDGGGA
jgi:hypothetical protein